MQTSEDFQIEATLGLYFLMAAMISCCPLETGYVFFTLLDSPSLPGVFPAWRPVSVAIYHVCTDVYLN